MTENTHKNDQSSTESRHTVKRRSLLQASGGMMAVGAFSLGGAAQTDNGLNVTIRQISRRNWPEIEVFASVTGETGEAVTGLDVGNFTVEEDSVEQSIESVTSDDGAQPEPISAALVIDKSGSMGGERIDNARQGAIEFVSQFQDDEGLVLAFNNQLTIERRWTRDSNTLTDTIEGITAGGNTALYDAAIEGIEEAAPRPGRSAVIVLSDGADNASTNSIDAAIDTANERGVPMYTIGVGNAIEPDKLERMADETGGEYYETINSDNLERIYNEISQAIANEYNIVYETSNDETDGTIRNVWLETVNGGDSSSDTGEYLSPCAPLPTAAFDVDPPTPAVDEPVEFDGSNSVPNGGEIVGYEWDFDNNGAIDATGETATYTYTESGTVEARLTVEKGCEGSGEVTNLQIQTLEIGTDATVGGGTLEILARQEPDFGYRITVEGNASGTSSGGVTDDDDDRIVDHDGGTTTILGSTGGRAGDAFSIDGDIVAFVTTGNPEYELQLDGVDVTDDVNDDVSTLNIIAEQEEDFEFRVTVEGDAWKTSTRNPDHTADSEDSVTASEDGTTVVTGSTGGQGGDAFTIDGTITSVDIATDAEYRLLLDGEEIEPDDLPE